MIGVCAVAERGASVESPTRTTIARQKIGRKDRKGEREHAFGGVGETRVESRGKSRRGKGKRPNDTCRLDRRSSEACKTDDDSRAGIVTENIDHLSVKFFNLSRFDSASRRAFIERGERHAFNSCSLGCADARKKLPEIYRTSAGRDAMQGIAPGPEVPA